VAEVDHRGLELRRDFAGDPGLAELEDVLAPNGGSLPANIARAPEEADGVR